MSPTDLLSRLCPLPKQCRCRGLLSVAPDQLVVHTVGEDAWTARAAAELRAFLAAATGVEPPVVAEVPADRPAIHLVGDGHRRAFADRFAAPFFADFTADPGFDGYRVTTPDNALVVQGLDPAGVYWGMKTLKQLVTFDGQRLLIPRVDILDGGDLEQRGIWTQPFSSSMCCATDPDDLLRRYRARFDWLSDHKMNVVEVIAVGEGGGISFRSARHPEFAGTEVDTKEFLLRELVAYGRQRGIAVVPIFSHPEHFGFMARKFPELEPTCTTHHHGRDFRVALDFYQDGTRRVLQDLAEELVDLCDPPALCFWLAENRLFSRPPADVSEREFVRQAGTYHAVVEALRQSRPDLGLKVLLSQGSFPENAEVIASLPRDVEWIYYSGERFGTYNIRDRNCIHHDIATAARRGHWLSLCNALRGTTARPVILTRLREQIRDAVHAGFRGLDGMSYAFPGDNMGLFHAADQAWFCDGRPLDETSAAYARELGAADPDAQARSYALYDDANLALASRNTIGVGHPHGRFSRFGCMIDRLRTDAPVDEMTMMMVDELEDDDVPVIAGAIADVEAAIAMADPAADALHLARCRYLLAALNLCRHVVRMFYVVGREKSCDLYKGDWDDFRAELRQSLAAIAAVGAVSEPLFQQVLELEQWSARQHEFADPLGQAAAAAAEIDPDRIRSSREL